MRKWITLRTIKRTSKKITFQISHQDPLLKLRLQHLGQSRFGRWKIASVDCPEVQSYSDQFFVQGEMEYRNHARLSCTIENWESIKKSLSSLRKALNEYEDNSIENEFFERS